MLSRNTASTLVDLLSNTSDPVSCIQAQFDSDLSFDERVIALTTISVLLSNGLLDHYQQIAAAWLIYAEFEDSSLDENPFLTILAYINRTHQLHPNRFSPSLCDLLPIILSGTPLDFLRNLTIPQIMQGAFSAPGSTQKPLSPMHFNDIRMPPFLIEETSSNTGADFNDVLIDLISSVDFSESISPPWVRPVPDIFPITRSELEYISSIPPPPLFDTSAEIHSRETSLSLLARATEAPLGSSEVRTLLDAVERFPSIVETFELNDDRLLSLIEKNPEIAKVFVVKLLQSRPQFWSCITGMGISVATAEVAKVLLQSGLFTETLVNEYVSKTVEIIYAIKEKSVMLAKAQLFCRFMTVFKPNNLKFEGNLMLTLRTFCIEMASAGIPEANELCHFVN